MLSKNYFKGLVQLIRPFTLLAPIIVSICIMIASLFYNQNTDQLFSLFFVIILPASFSLAILNGASNALNQVTDLESDKISKPYRPIPKGLITIKQALIISVVLYSIAIFLAAFINFMFLIFVLSIVFFTVSYSIPPRLKDVLFLNQLWVGIPRGLLGILASWSVFGNAFETLPLTIGIIAMVYLIGGSITKDITDSKADKKTGTKTLINTYGLKRSALMVFPFMFFPFAFIPILIDSGILDTQFWLLTLLAIPSIFVFYLMIRDEKKGKCLENTLSWTLMYVTYFFLAFGFSVLTIAGKIFS